MGRHLPFSFARNGAVDHDDLGSLLEEPLQPILTRRLRLRRPAKGDAASMARLADDAGVASMLARLPHPYTIDHAHAFLAACDRELVFAVTRRADDALLGMCGLRPTAVAQTVDLGYWLGRPHWRQGFATEAAQAVVDLAFMTLGSDCVSAKCRAINLASRRVLEKCGFQPRGTGTFVSVAAGRVSGESFHLDRGAWAALKAWGQG